MCSYIIFFFLQCIDILIRTQLDIKIILLIIKFNCTYFQERNNESVLEKRDFGFALEFTQESRHAKIIFNLTSLL